jgi:hypothetical protein
MAEKCIEQPYFKSMYTTKILIYLFYAINNEINSMIQKNGKDEYIAHYLNTSPTKASYSFSREPRFEGNNRKAISPFTARHTYTPIKRQDRPQRSATP